MKKLLSFLLFIVVPLLAICQENTNLKAMIAEYKYTDTIRIADCSKLSGILLNNNGYSVKGFTLLFTDKGSDFEYVSNSDKFSDKMKNALSKLSIQDNKIRYIIIKDINVLSSQNKKVTVENIIYKLRM